MRLWSRLVLLPSGLGAVGAAAAVLWAGGPFAQASWAALGAGVTSAAAVALVSFRIVRRARAFAHSVQEVAEAKRAVVTGEDALETVQLTFGELALTWRLSTEELEGELRVLIAVLDGMREGVWITDALGVVRRHNLPLAQLLTNASHPQQPLVGERPLSLIRSTELHEAVLAACERGTASSMEVTVDAPRPRILSVQVVPLQGAFGSAAVFRDVTELRKLESMRKDFVSNVSHELRTPLAAIRGYAETLKEGALADPEHAPRMVDVILRQSERLSALVADLLELSRLESGGIVPERTRVPLADTVARVMEVVGPRAQDKQQSVTVDLSPALVALGDPRAVEQILLNLVDNAVKYTPERGSVRVEGRLLVKESGGGQCQITVADSGPGIEARHLPRVFERFYRIDKGRSRDTGGTGLGLAIVKHLAASMDGEVKVESEPGKGSRFILLLPAP